MPLPGPIRPQVRIVGRTPGSCGARPVGIAAPCGMVVTIAGSTSNRLHSRASCVRHNDHVVRHRSDRYQSGPLVRSGVTENRVGDHDGRNL